MNALKENDKFKQNVFAHAFSAFDSSHALKQYYEIFEKPEKQGVYDYEYEEFEPQGEEDVLEMLNAARRLGIVT